MQELAAKMNLDDTGKLYQSLEYFCITVYMVNQIISTQINKNNPAIIIGDWVDNGKTLREQGIVESEVLLLKRKLFFKEDEDTDNPLQRNMLYEQVR